ncbi:MAG TPA: HAD-IIIA family hydrolase, partial [Phycisphaerae bacterium]|nr:HAD-IIIA family hydrolase [Phycisphaerae bacterium]
QAGAHVDASYYCPYHPEGTVPEYRIDHEWRKPRPGMLKAAAEDFNLDLSQSWMIGDMMRDIAAGAAVGCRTILLSDPEKPLPADKDSLSVTPNFVVRTLADAARIIVREGNIPVRDPAPAPLSTTPTAGVPTVAAGEVPRHVEPPVTQPPPPAATATIDSTLVAAAVAEAVSSAVKEHLAKAPTPAASPPPATVLAQESHKPLLEEMLQQLRQFNRRQDLHGFSLSLLFASTLQVLVLLFLAVAAWDALIAVQITYKDHTWWYDKTTDQLFALAWLMAALVVQGMVLALYVRHRNK